LADFLLKAYECFARKEENISTNAVSMAPFMFTLLADYPIDYSAPALFYLYTVPIGLNALSITRVLHYNK